MKKATEYDLLDEAAGLYSEKLCITDIQMLRGLVIGEHLEDKAKGYKHGDLEHGGMHQNRRIIGYLNYLEDEILKPRLTHREETK